MKGKFVGRWSKIFDQTVLVLSIKNGFLQNQKIHFLTKLYVRYAEILRSKIVHLKKIYKFGCDHFLIKRTVFVLS